MSAEPTIMADAPAATPAAAPESVAPEAAPAPAPSVAASWRDSLPVDLRDHPTLAGIDDIDSLAKEHVNVQKLIGVDKIPRPQEDWTEEQYADLYTKLGRPADVSDYDLEGITPSEGLPWDDGLQESMVSAMHEAGLSNAQVRKVLSSYIESVDGQYQEFSGEAQRSRESGIQDLRNEWGKSFDAQVELAKRAFTAGAGESYEALADLELAGGGKLGDNPQIIKAFAALGSKMSEHGLVGGTAQRSVMSPGEAGGERNKLMSDPDFLKAYLDKEHLEHGLAVKKINDLTEMEVASS